MRPQKRPEEQGRNAPKPNQDGPLLFSPTLKPKPGVQDCGFTLLEALVALAILAAGLAAIGQLGFSSLAASRRAAARLDLTSAARAALASLPDRRAPSDGAASGDIFHDRWRLVAVPYADAPSGGPLVSVWTPQSLQLQVVGPFGESIVVETVRLRRGKP